MYSDFFKNIFTPKEVVTAQIFNEKMKLLTHFMTTIGMYAFFQIKIVSCLVSIMCKVFLL